MCLKLAESLANGTFVRLMLSSSVQLAESPEKILGRCVTLKGAPHLSLTLRYAKRDVTRNIPASEAVAWLDGQLRHHFRSALLCTTTRDWQFSSNGKGAARVVSHKPSIKDAPTTAHDRKRDSLLDASANDWLTGLGILDREAKLRASMADKHRQIAHYLEIFSHLAKDCSWTDRGESGASPGLHFADMGSGKGYLTFGLWHLFHRGLQQPVKVTGVEARADLVATTNQLARKIHAEGLTFVEGTIASAELPGVDGLIALHACNTATDDAILRGIKLGAKLIVVAPCCHQEVRPQLGQPEPLTGVLRHGLMAERMAEWTTDGLRALYLEWAGYRTKIMEFIGSEHTPKNLMLAGVRERQAFADARIRDQIVALKNFFSIQHHALDRLLE